VPPTIAARIQPEKFRPGSRHAVTKKRIHRAVVTHLETRAAPDTGDFEIRYNITDGQSNAITMLDLHQFLMSIKRALIENRRLPCRPRPTTARRSLVNRR
jgi:hypothetical protein